MSFNCQRELIVAFLVLKDPFFFSITDTIMDLLNCPEARHAILDYYQTSGEPQAVQEAIMTSQESAGKTVSMDTMTKL